MRGSSLSASIHTTIENMLDTKALPKMPAAPGIPRSLLANLIVFAASIGLLVTAYHLLKQRLTTVSSRDAVISADFVEMNAAIDGVVDALTVRPGDVLKATQPLLSLQNERTNQLGVQQIRSRITDLQTQQQRLAGQLARNAELAAAVEREGATEVSFKVERVDEDVDRLQAELAAKESELKMAQLTLGRVRKLAVAGALPQAQLDQAQIEVDRLTSNVQASQASLNKIKVDQATTRTGLNPDRERNNYDSRIRLQELNHRIADQRAELSLLQQNQKNAQAELGQAQADQKQIAVGQASSPIDGVLYELKVRSGQFVQKGTYLGRILNCQQRWVEVTVDEPSLKSITPGKAATISLNALPDKTLTGKVTLIRSGTGRLQPGQDVALPIAPNLPRTSQVRVELDANTDQGSPGNLCYVGYTGQVAFAK
jgi:multidrug resistance efflux pump